MKPLLDLAIEVADDDNMVGDGQQLVQFVADDVGLDIPQLDDAGVKVEDDVPQTGVSIDLEEGGAGGAAEGRNFIIWCPMAEDPGLYYPIA